jgi:hypothetical protein
MQGSTGNKLFSSETLKATQMLKQLITSGCFSDIPPGGGTNRNERTHNHINGLFNKSKIAIFLAFSLLAVVLYLYSCSDG